MSELLVLKDVTKSFGGLTAVNNVNVTIATGELTSLVGPNGAGKSTLFGLVGGQVKPTSGTITWDGVEISGRSPEEIAHRGIGRTFQTSRPFEGFTLLENTYAGTVSACKTTLVEDFLHSPRRSRELRENKEFARELISLVGLSRLESTKISHLSYGQRRVAEIARALAIRPRMLLLDEPAAGLNSKEAHQLGELLTSLIQRLGIGVLLVEHNLPLVVDISDKIAVLDFGRLITFGVPSEVVADERVIAAYVGDHL